MSDPSLSRAESPSEAVSRPQFASVQIPQASCPTDDALASFLDDPLPEEKRDALCHHVDECQNCQIRLDRLIGGESGVAERIQRHGSVLSYAASLEPTTADVRTPDQKQAGLPHIPGFDVLELIGKG